MIREAVKENNQELCRELKESMVKETGLSVRSREEREEERDRRLEQRSEEYYQRWTSCCGKRPGDNCGNSRKRRRRPKVEKESTENRKTKRKNTGQGKN